MAQASRATCPECRAEVGNQPTIFAQGQLWHREHFRCANNDCRRQLDSNYQLFENRPYCLECHANRRNPRCALETCQQVLAGEVYFALDNYWHPQCFRCEGCSRPLEGGNYYLVDNRPYDLACHWGRRLALQNRNDQL
uniref:LIM zinc-binding domain-containing protein n=1 Tax=Meloidogyne enterolobii TaxID=390850 RepID=A0A6V7Y3A7_MELEN|nr:unnamed protein product [Meloidogyne enterolobii]